MVYDFSDGRNIAIYAVDEGPFVSATDGSAECGVGAKDLLVVLESFCNFATIQPASPRGWVGQDMLIRTFT